MHKHISRKQMPSATYNFHFHLDGESPSVVVVFFHYREGKEESRNMLHVMKNKLRGARCWYVLLQN